MEEIYYEIKHIAILSFSLVLISLLSCSKNNLAVINPSSTSIDFEGEGGLNDVFFTDGDWKITKVVNQDNDKNIFGNVYSPAGDLVRENKALELDGLGSLEAIWPDKGFIISRETATSIAIQMKENFTKEDFGFIIFVESGNNSRQIMIHQKPSQGYEIKSIAYALEKDDGDSIFVQRGETRSFSIHTTVPPTLTFDPFLNTSEVSQFESDTGSAFPWKQTDSVMVKIPTQIFGDQIFTDGATSPYSYDVAQRNSKFGGQMEKVTLPQGESMFVVWLEYRKRKVTYTLNIVNNRTNDNKVIIGKWIETAPTGNYEIEWQ